MTQSNPEKTMLDLSDLSPYVYGTTRLGNIQIPFEDRVQLARDAMNAGIWFHTSHTYGNALEVLRAAFDQDRSRVPKLIVKIGWSSIAELRDVIRLHLSSLNLPTLDIAQLCLSGPLADEFASGGACYRELEKLKEEALVRRFVIEVFPWTSAIALNAFRGGYPQGVVEGCIFYLNPLQRFASNELWDLLLNRNIPVIAMRTVSGGPVYRLRDVPGAAWKGYLQKRAAEIAPIFERSGIQSWTEFCVRFAFSFAPVRATVGSTAHVENLREYLRAIQEIQPLPRDLIVEISAHQQRWSDEMDILAEPWTM